MSYNFVSIWTVDDTQPPARPPVASSDLYATSGSVLSQISTVFQEARNTTTNVLSQDCYVTPRLPLSVVNTKGIGISTLSSDPNIPAAGAFVTPGGVVSTLTIAAALLSDFEAN